MKVMIVEDEILVRLGLRKAIPWSTLGMDLICEAKDGLEASELFDIHLPDIVIVDIELPLMNGFEFIQLARTHRPDSKFIVLTCHQDMKYTREAIQLHVSDFILKSTLDMDELCEILKSIAAEIVQERNRAEKLRTLNAVKAIPDTVFFQNWLNGIQFSSGQILLQLQEMAPSMKTTNRRFQAWVIQLELDALVNIEFSLTDVQHFGRKIIEQAVQHFGESYIGGVEEIQKYRWHLIMYDIPAAADILSWMEMLKHSFGIPISIGKSGVFVHPHEWQVNDRRASELLQLQFYHQGGQLYVSEKESPLSEVMSKSVLSLKKEINEQIGLLQFERVRAHIMTMCVELNSTPHLHPDIVKNMFTEFLFRIWSVSDVLASEHQITNRQLIDQMYLTQKLEHAVRLLLEDMERVRQQLSFMDEIDDKTRVVDLIKQYVNNHLHKEISLQEIADTVHMNTSYLSRLFREVAQMGFTEYVLHQKTEMAILMMQNGKSLTEISEKLGYLNLSSFTRMFKKVRGMSPSKFTPSS
ncbi:hypothetical protein Back11_36930 [Paenibacillus baekrokdamisoli]|uniref:Uncharacterized protein n=1 Tax=Paenibacillus baekrokdamisoli TaxID=1712516 RepID=A0A3G9JEB4_9BACL|nr:response regulator [Paenibacillus baekrokdamisoli]MBB3072600.1 two-component system response regulator YesN [Paenibacillus baekrokdamisoli]BBH22348.1 hypothetical protein Back11_36930 [Paenibacillus baekrokdamisoli]